MFDRLKNFFTKQPIESKQKKAPSTPNIFYPGHGWTQGEPAPMGAKEQLMAYQSWVYASVRRIAQEVANIELKLYRVRKSGKEDIIGSHVILDTLYNVNKNFTFYDLIETTQTYLELTGEAYWFMTLNGRKEPVEIYPWLRPDRMTVYPSEDPAEYIKGFAYQAADGSKVPLAKEEVLYFKYTNPLDTYRGMSPITAAAMAINTDTESSKWNWRFFSNNATPKGVLKIAAPFSEAMYKQIEANWNAAHRGTDNANKLAILFGGRNSAIDYSEIGLSQRDMDFLSQRQMSREEILTIMGTSMSILNPDRVVNRATVEAAYYQFMRSTIKPKMKKLVSYLNEFFIPRFKLNETLYLDFVDPVPDDTEAEIKKYESAIKNGWMSRNEVRLAEGMGAVEGGEVLYLPSNYIPAGQTESVKSYKQPKQVKYYKNSISNRINEVVSDKLEKQMSLFKQAVPKKEIKEDSEFEKLGQAMWEKKVARTDIAEIRLQDELKTIFEEQRKEVVGSLTAKKSIKNKEYNYSFNKAVYNEKIKQILLDTYLILGYEFGKDAMEGAGVSDDFIFSKEQRELLETTAMQVAESVNTTTEGEIDKQIAAAIAAGLTITEARNEINGMYKTKVEDERGFEISRTEISWIVGVGTVWGYLQSNKVIGKQWFTALDERVCPFCSSMHGAIVGLEDSFFDKGKSMEVNGNSLDFSFRSVEAPPLHPRCRCQLVPIYK